MFARSRESIRNFGPTTAYRTRVIGRNKKRKITELKLSSHNGEKLEFAVVSIKKTYFYILVWSNFQSVIKPVTIGPHPTKISGAASMAHFRVRREIITHDCAEFWFVYKAHPPAHIGICVGGCNAVDRPKNNQNVNYFLPRP